MVSLNSGESVAKAAMSRCWDASDGAAVADAPDGAAVAEGLGG